MKLYYLFPKKKKKKFLASPPFFPENIAVHTYILVKAVFFVLALKFILIRMLIIPCVLVSLSLSQYKLFMSSTCLFSLSNYSCRKIFYGGNFVD